MAICTVQYFSNALRRFTTFTAILPNDLPPEMMGDNPHFRRPTKVLTLLHGYSGCETDWLYNTPVSELAGRYNMAILMPGSGNSFYLDGPETGSQYGTFVGEELPSYAAKLFGLSTRRGSGLFPALSRPSGLHTLMYGVRSPLFFVNGGMPHAERHCNCTGSQNAAHCQSS